MCRKQSANVGDESRPPFLIVQSNIVAIRPTDPRHDTEASKRVQEAFDLNSIDRWDFACGISRTQMWEDIGNVMTTKLSREFANAFWIPVTNELVRLPVLEEPFVGTKPAMRNPNPIAAAVVASVPHVKSGSPQHISEPQQN